MLLFILASFFLGTSSTGTQTEHIGTIKADFYSSVLTSSSSTRIAVYDAGNKYISIYTHGLKKVAGFGKEGNGPGEFSSGVHRLLLTDTRVYVFTWKKVMVFSIDGKHITDTLLKTSRYSQIVASNNTITVFNGVTPYVKDIKLTLNEDGKIISRIEAPKAFESEKRAMHLISFNDHYIQTYYGSYYASVLNTSKKIQRNFSRFKATEAYFNFPKSWSKEQYAMALQQAMKMTGGFKDDLKAIFPIDKHQFVIATETSSNKELAFDIYNKAFEFINTKTLTFNHPVTEFRIENGYVLVSLNSDEDGPYIEIYKLNQIKVSP